MTPRSLEFIIPGDLHARTGGYGYDRRIIAGLRALGWQVSVHSLDESFPDPSAAALSHAHAVFGRLPQHSLVLVDGLAAGAMPQILQPHAMRLRLVALVHHPLAAESGLSPVRAAALMQSERLALQAMSHVIVTSSTTLIGLAAYGVDRGRVSVVEPGTDMAQPTPHPAGAILKLLCVATLIPRKGHDVLFDALAALGRSDWRLTCVGSLTRDPLTVERLRGQIQRLRLAHQVELAGELDEQALCDCYDDADLFVLPTRLEGYGMAVAEALAHGLPVISTRTGAIPGLLVGTAGLLIEPDDVDALRAALARVMRDPAALGTLAAGAAAARAQLPRWEDCCQRMAQVLTGCSAATGCA